jgi:hypothetical protein
MDAIIINAGTGNLHSVQNALLNLGYNTRITADPADLAAVAAGRLETWEPQPYAVLSLDQYLFDPGFDHERGKRYLVGDTAYDRERGLLYVFERMADEDEKSIVHVFRLDLPAAQR